MQRLGQILMKKNKGALTIFFLIHISTQSLLFVTEKAFEKISREWKLMVIYGGVSRSGFPSSPSPSLGSRWLLNLKSSDG